MGNVGSLMNILRKLGSDAQVTSDAADIGRASKLVLPGVGAFDAAMSRIRAAGFIEPLHDKVVHERTPILGICLGMQLLMERSEEGTLSGFGWIRGSVRRFQPSSGHPVPHMGWNRVVLRRETALTREMEDEPRFYFVHSYYVQCDDPADVMLTATYGLEFCAAVARGNIFGVQFHPEKSHRYGLRLFRNFVEA